jgi:hypothetical protein
MSATYVPIQPFDLNWTCVLAIYRQLWGNNARQRATRQQVEGDCRRTTSNAVWAKFVWRQQSNYNYLCEKRAICTFVRMGKTVQEDILGCRDIMDNGKVDGASRVRSLPIAQWHDQLCAKSSTNASFVFSQTYKTKSHKVVSPIKSHGISARLTVALQGVVKRVELEEIVS